jgi:hypothetical protein
VKKTVSVLLDTKATSATKCRLLAYIRLPDEPSSMNVFLPKATDTLITE